MKKRVLVTATGGRSVGSGILHALVRSSAEVTDRWEVTAADADPFAWGLYVAPRGVLLPSARSAGYVDRLNGIIRDHAIDAVVPGSQDELFLLAREVSRVAAPVLMNRPELIPLMTDKVLVKTTLEQLGHPFIETFPLDQWHACVAQCGYPLVVKPTVSTGASRDVLIVADEQELQYFIRHHDPLSKPCIQAYVGSGNEEYTVGVLTDHEGSLVDSIVMKRKLMGLSLQLSRRIGDRQCAISSGYSQGFIVRDERIQSFCERLALDLKSIGPLNIQLRVDGERIYVFEIHPRFSGTTPMRADVGFNEVDLLLRNRLFGTTFGRLDYRANVAAIRAFEHVIVPIESMPAPLS